MCGIAGQLRSLSGTVNHSFFENAKTRLSPRGPDDEGLLQLEDCFFLHRRLSIQDLSDRGHQPMSLENEGLHIVYNGEIYNFKELRKELEEKGHRFFSHSDTEVLLRGYKEWREDLLPRLNGMFAFAIYEQKNKELFLARDRLGIKPLYFRTGKEGFYFCSDLRPLIHTENESPQLNLESLSFYMSFHSIVPAPLTLVKNVFKLEPGHFLRVNSQLEIKKQKYWRLQYHTPDSKKNLNLREWKELLHEALKISVKRRLVADVPVGVFLSGGLDSSLVTALMRKTNSNNIQTFSVGFSDTQEEEGNEFKYSRMVAKRYETHHHEIKVSTEDLLEHLPAALNAQAEPMVSHDNIGFFLLSQFSSQHVKVVQSGQGADEVFAGYHWYPHLAESTNLTKDYARLFFDFSYEELKKVFKRPLLQTNTPMEFIHKYFSECFASTPLDKALHLDSHIMLIDDPVKRVDNNTMAWGLEARVPFLDHELMELAAQIPGDLKLKNGGKGILKDLGYDLLPKEVIDRPKGYFPVPELKYIQGPFLTFVKNILSQPGVKRRGLFKEEFLSQLLEDSSAHITPLKGSKLWQVAVLEDWLEKNEVEVPA